MAIQSSVNGLVKFMRATSAGQRSLLRNYKFPFDAKGRRKPQIFRYTEASAAVVEYHKSGNNKDVLDNALESLVRRLHEQPELDAAILADNIRALTTYKEHFSGTRYQVLPNPKPKYQHGEVIVSAHTDLYVAEAETTKLIKLDFKADRTEKDLIQIVLRVTHEAGLMSGLDLEAKNVVYIDVGRQTKHFGKELNKRLRSEVEAACDTIAAIWAGLKQ